MNDEINAKHLSIKELAQKCAQETDRFHRQQSYDPQYCFELFQRAFRGLEDAWHALQRQYKSQVAGWVTRHPGFHSSGEEIDYFVSGTLFKFWNAMTPTNFQRFDDLGSLLRYLQMCVHSVISDYNRSNDLADTYDPTEELKQATKPETRKSEANVLNGVYWQKCREWLDTRLNNLKERLVIKLYIDDALKPREIYAHSPNVFENVDEVYRIRQNVFARLARDPEFDQFCGEGD